MSIVQYVILHFIACVSLQFSFEDLSGLCFIVAAFWEILINFHTHLHLICVSIFSERAQQFIALPMCAFQFRVSQVVSQLGKSQSK